MGPRPHPARLDGNRDTLAAGVAGGVRRRGRWGMKADGGRGRLTVTIHAGGALAVHALGPAVPVGGAIPSGLGLDTRLIVERLRELAFLNPGAAFELVDETRGGRRVSFVFQGIDEWVALLTEGQAVFPA